MDTDVKIDLTDLQFRNLAEHIPPDKVINLGLSLGLTKTDLASISQGVRDPLEKTFRVLDCWRTNLDPFLIRWRNKVDGRQTERVKLESAMRENGLGDFIPCIDAHVTRKDNNSGEGHPTVNLSLPNEAHDADKKQEIEIRANLSSDNKNSIQTSHKHLYCLVLHPADTEQNWSKICRLKSVFERHGKLSNIEMLPICFTVDVVSLDSLNQLQGSIDNERLEMDLLDILVADDESIDRRELRLELSLDRQSYSNGERFFKDLDPTLSLLERPMTDNGASHRLPGDDFNAWPARKPETELPDTNPGVGLVWRNLSQQQFGF